MINKACRFNHKFTKFSDCTKIIAKAENVSDTKVYILYKCKHCGEIVVGFTKEIRGIFKHPEGEEDLNKAIDHCNEVVAGTECKECKREHLQLKGWLEELKRFRRVRENEKIIYKSTDEWINR